MEEFLSQFCEIEQMSMMDFVDAVNHAIQYFKLSREQYIKIYDLLVKEEGEIKWKYHTPKKKSIFTYLT